MRFNGVLFDLDGTLLDTVSDIGFYINRTLSRHGYSPFPQEKVHSILGWGLKVALSKVLPEDKASDDAYLSELTAELIEDYNSNPVIDTVPYPGIPELLAELKRRGIKLGVFSNKADPVTRRVLDITFGKGFFDAVLGSDAGFPRKPEPAGALDVVRRMGLPAEDVLYVGDTPMDHKTAVNAGIFDITVTWGFRTREHLMEKGVTRFVETPDEILQYF